MRPLRVLAVLSALLVAVPSFAQEWSTYTNNVDRFEGEQNGNRYSVTVIDYTNAEVEKIFD